MQSTTIEAIKPGEYFRKAGQSRVYVKGEYIRASKRWEASAFDDVNKFVYLKKGAAIETDFDF